MWLFDRLPLPMCDQSCETGGSPTIQIKLIAPKRIRPKTIAAERTRRTTERLRRNDTLNRSGYGTLNSTPGPFENIHSVSESDGLRDFAQGCFGPKFSTSRKQDRRYSVTASVPAIKAREMPPKRSNGGTVATKPVRTARKARIRTPRQNCKSGNCMKEWKRTSAI